MRRKLSLLGACCGVAALALAAVVMQAKTPGDNTDFSGTWVLEVSQTKNVPEGLDSYTMKVSQDGGQMKVETALQGDLRPSPPTSTQNAGGYPAGGSTGGGGYPGGGYPGGGYPGGGYPGGGGMGRGGMGRGGMGRGGPTGMPSQRVEYMAYKYYPASVAYALDGSQGTAELGDPDQSQAASRAEWAGGGKELKLSLDSSDDSGNKADQIKVKDDWKFDGNYLRIARTVKTSHGSETVHLVFRKQLAENPPAPGTDH
jgi:hypothetical protein